MKLGGQASSVFPVSYPRDPNGAASLWGCGFGDVIRPAVSGDAEAIARVHVRGWQQAYAHVFAQADLAALSAEGRIESARDLIGSPVAVVAEREGELLGFAFAGPSRDEVSVAELYSIYVDPSAWGTGLGRGLILEVERRLRQLQYRQAELWVLQDNPRARRFYEAADWYSDDVRLIEVFGSEVAEVRYYRHL
jgi:GNAT superfamily N-acetyltransferase